MNVIKHLRQPDGAECIEWIDPASGNWCLVVVKAHPDYKGLVWKWNGDLEKPSLTPSIKSTTYQRDGKTVRAINHYFMTNGVIEYCGDCTHQHAGKKLPLAEWKDD